MKTRHTLTFDLNKKLKGSKFSAVEVRTGQFRKETAIYVKWGWFDFCSTELGIYRKGKITWNMSLDDPKFTKVGKDYIVIDSINQKYAEDLEKLLDCEVIVVYK